MGLIKDISEKREYVALLVEEDGVHIKMFRLPEDYENNSRVAHLFYQRYFVGNIQHCFSDNRLKDIAIAEPKRFSEKGDSQVPSKPEPVQETEKPAAEKTSVSSSQVRRKESVKGLQPQKAKTGLSLKEPSPI